MTSGLCTAAASLLFWSPWQSLCQILISAAALSKCRNGKLVLEFCQGYFDICNVCSGCGSQWECCWLSFLRQAVCLSVCWEHYPSHTTGSVWNRPDKQPFVHVSLFYKLDCQVW